MPADSAKNDPVDDGKGKSADGETNKGVKNGSFGFLNFGCITTRGHVVNTTDDNVDDGNKTSNGDDGIQDTGDDGWKTIFAASASGSFPSGSSRFEAAACIGCCNI